VLRHLTDAQTSLAAAMQNAQAIDLEARNRRGFQQINNAIVRVDAAIDELAA